jgi:FlaA1/EpsC-like NDP-sugar epimerase
MDIFPIAACTVEAATPHNHPVYASSRSTRFDRKFASLSHPRPHARPIYTSPVIPSLENLDWRGFLARPELPPPAREALDGSRQEPILITGAGGSIGSALARRVGALGSARLVLLESSESNLYALERDWTAELAAHPCSTSTTTPVLGSVADSALLQEIFATHAPRIVFHGAAFKHVPLMEEQLLAAIANNIFATETLVNVAAARSARVILLSTDKAVEPASVMGATKRVAEQIVLAGGGTVLRLGNVLGSRDSVAEIFARQIAQGGPLTVTDPAARRYFLTLDEAVTLLLGAGALSYPSALLAPLLPATHFIADLAHFMAHELAPNHGITIDFTAPRPGDKETERLWKASDPTWPAGVDGMVLIEAVGPTAAQITRQLASLHAALDARDQCTALAQLRVMVPDYTPSQTVLAAARRQNDRCTHG